MELSVIVLFNFLVNFPFCRPFLQNFQPAPSYFQSILVFSIFIFILVAQHRFGL